MNTKIYDGELSKRKNAWMNKVVETSAIAREYNALQVRNR